MRMMPGRFLLFLVFLSSFFAVLLTRLVDVQLVRGATFLQRAEDNRLYSHRIPANRGVFLDRYQEPLVWNIQKYAKVANPDALYLSTVPIEREEALPLMATAPAQVTTSTERFYRYPLSLAHVTGYVGDVTAEDLQRDETLQVSQQIGKAGLEYVYEKELRGIDGKETIEINALGERQRRRVVQAARPGQNIQTTLDPYLSEIAARALGQQQGGVVVTAADTGEVLALVSQPAFDPNILSHSLVDKEQERARKEVVKALFTDPRKLFFDRVISGAYPPGSVFKLVTALSGLENGKLDGGTTVVDEGILRVGEFEFGNWYYRQYGRVEGAIGLVRSIARSNDIFFYKAAEWIGPEQLAQSARLLGYGEKTGIDLPAETRGLVPDPEWKRKVKNEAWFLGNTYHFGIGQGDLLTSPIQVAQMTQALANNGTLCKVNLVPKKERECTEVVPNKDHLRMVVEGMTQACSAGGTAFPFFPYNARRLSEGASLEQKLANGVAACKTGTAEFGAANEKGYRPTHGWFTVFLRLPELAGVASASAEPTATASASILNSTTTYTASDLSEQQLHQLWLSHQSTHPFPSGITITVLVESDEQNVYKEGSRDAAPIAKKMVDWLLTGATTAAQAPTPSAPPADPTAGLSE